MLRLIIQFSSSHFGFALAFSKGEVVITERSNIFSLLLIWCTQTFMKLIKQTNLYKTENQKCWLKDLRWYHWKAAVTVDMRHSFTVARIAGSRTLVCVVCMQKVQQPCLTPTELVSNKRKLVSWSELSQK